MTATGPLPWICCWAGTVQVARQLLCRSWRPPHWPRQCNWWHLATWAGGERCLVCEPDMQHAVPSAPRRRQHCDQCQMLVDWCMHSVQQRSKRYQLQRMAWLLHSERVHNVGIVLYSPVPGGSTSNCCGRSAASSLLPGAHKVRYIISCQCVGCLRACTGYVDSGACA